MAGDKNIANSQNLQTCSNYSTYLLTHIIVYYQLIILLLAKLTVDGQSNLISLST